VAPKSKKSLGVTGVATNGALKACAPLGEYSATQKCAKNAQNMSFSHKKSENFPERWL